MGLPPDDQFQSSPVLASCVCGLESRTRLVSVHLLVLRTGMERVPGPPVAAVR